LGRKLLNGSPGLTYDSHGRGAHLKPFKPLTFYFNSILSYL
jgi:hypothetical protein